LRADIHKIHQYLDSLDETGKVLSIDTLMQILTRANENKMDIIQPKSITGLMPLISNEPKATIVVSVVNKQGLSICSKVGAFN
jgi:hypothetical protein